MQNLLWIFLGSGLGGSLRFTVTNTLHFFLGRAFPYGTLFVNVTGSLLMGILFSLLVERLPEHAEVLRAFILVGVLGGYTTFSAFAIESAYLIDDGYIYLAALNMIANVVLCVSAAMFGVIWGKALC